MLEYIIFPSSYFSSRQIDEDLAAEYEAVMSAGLFKTLLFGYDDWFENGRLVLTDRPDEEASALYRGWMMKPEQYDNFYNKLLENNIRLLTSPDEYRRFHIFPNIYPDIADDTAKTLTFPDGSEIDFDRIKKEFPRFMVKDYVKSVKGTSFPKYFDSSVDKDEFGRCMETFYKYCSGLYTGGICIKEYLDLKTYDGKTNEYRIFFADGRIVSVSRNSLQPDYTKEFDTDFMEKYQDLGSPFYTLDCAELADGTWIIIEAGDGQVSGLSDGQSCYSFFKALYYAFL